MRPLGTRVCEWQPSCPRPNKGTFSSTRYLLHEQPFKPKQCLHRLCHHGGELGNPTSTHSTPGKMTAHHSLAETKPRKVLLESGLADSSCFPPAHGCLFVAMGSGVMPLSFRPKSLWSAMRPRTQTLCYGSLFWE